MLIGKKKKQAYKKYDSSKSQVKRCIQSNEENNPEKIAKNLLSKEELKQRNLEYIKNKDNEAIAFSEESKTNILTTLSSLAGITTISKISCGKPLIIALGVPIGVGVAAYFLLKHFFGW